MSVEDDLRAANAYLLEEEGLRDLEQGRDLALRLRWAATGLSFDKATEFSPDVQACFLLAAKVALLSYGKNSSELEQFERDVRGFVPTSWIAEDYEVFKLDQLAGPRGTQA